MEILWSAESKSDFENNIEYLLNEWGELSATNFIEEVESILEVIKANPKLYPQINYKSIRRAVIRKQITLFYLQQESSIYLVRFWNTWQDPKSLKL